jgi:hypothetical protein
MIRVLLTLDLIKSEDERTKFYTFLSKNGWKKTKDVDTVWTITFPALNDGIASSRTEAKVKIRDVFYEAAKALKLKEISYIAQIGNQEFISRVIEKRNGEYGCFARELYPPKV